ncbi:TPA: hypothetical protein DCR49_09865 [Candidatus Delongbacteria bacterium]|nr:hypothetical protein [Candidatus Delongbacteria bacterium]
MKKSIFLFIAVIMVYIVLFAEDKSAIKTSSPINIKISCQENTVILEWDSVPSAERYFIYEKENPNSAEVLIDSTNTTVWSGDITGNKRFYEITATDNMVFVQGGTFNMGDYLTEGDLDERPVHSVTVSDFYINRYEVTVQQFCDMLNYANQEGLLNAGTWTASNKIGKTQQLIDMVDNHVEIRFDGTSFKLLDETIALGKQNCGVAEVTWYGAAFYCNMRSRKEGLTELYNLEDWSCNFSGTGYRLPTEAEWEYAARGGIHWADSYRFSGSDLIEAVAWYYDNSDSTTHPVGSKMPNQLGIYDMSGNVFEWCWDLSDYPNHDYYQACYNQGTVVNPTGPATAGTETNDRVMRCGGWDWGESTCRLANRYHLYPEGSHKSYGFRIVRTP